MTRTKCSNSAVGTPSIATRPVPPDGHPVLGFARDVSNVYIVFTHSGVSLAPLIGEFAAIEILDGARIEALEPYRLERFT